MNHDIVKRFMADKMKSRQPTLDLNSWTMIIVGNWNEVDTDWCLENLEGQFICMGNYWFFERQEDITMFALRWS
jgi:hypothetical protein